MTPGHRELTDVELSLITDINRVAEQIKVLANAIDEFNSHRSDMGDDAMQETITRGHPFRWSSIAVTHFQEGFMALRRAVAMYQGF